VNPAAGREPGRRISLFRCGPRALAALVLAGRAELVARVDCDGLLPAGNWPPRPPMATTHTPLLPIAWQVRRTRSPEATRSAPPPGGAAPAGTPARP